MSRRGGCAKGLGLGCFGLILLLVIAIIALQVISANRMRGEMAKVGKGHILTVDDLANIKVPDSENAAILYQRALNIMGTSSTNSNLKTIDDFSSPEERAANPKLWDETRKAVESQKAVIDLINEAQKRPKCRFPVNWKAGPAALFPHFAYYREFARILSADALIKAHDGDMSGSVQSTVMVLKLSDHLKDEPTLIGQLVRIAVLKIGTANFRESLRYGKINESQALSLYNTLAGIDMFSSFARGMEGERAIGLSSFDMARRSPAGLLSLGSGGGSTASVLLGRAWGATIAPMDRAVYISWMGKQIEASKHPYREAEAKGLIPSESDIPKYAIATRIICPVFSRAGLSRDTAAAEIFGTQTLLALTVYKQRYGSYPSDLAELRKKINWKLNKDPLTGKDFIYKLKNGDFILYSVGQNMKDDGGIPRKYRYGAGKEDDIVWKSKPDPIVVAPKSSGPPMLPAPGPLPPGVAPGPAPSSGPKPPAPPPPTVL